MNLHHTHLRQLHWSWFRPAVLFAPLAVVLILGTTRPIVADCLLFPSVSVSSCLECSSTFQLTVTNNGAPGYIGYDIFQTQGLTNLGWFETGQSLVIPGAATEGIVRTFVSLDGSVWRQEGAIYPLDIDEHSDAGWTCLPADEPDNVVYPGPLSDTVVWEAEHTVMPAVESSVDPECVWELYDDSANGASGDLAYGPGPNVVDACFGLSGAKLIYRIQLQTPGTYELYVRNRTPEPTVNRLYVSNLPGEPARSLVVGSNTASYSWNRVFKTYTVVDISKPLTLVISPANGSVVLDKIALSLRVCENIWM